MHACMYTYIYICVSVCIYTHKHTHKHTHTHTCVLVCVYIHSTRIHKHTYMYKYHFNRQYVYFRYQIPVVLRRQWNAIFTAGHCICITQITKVKGPDRPYLKRTECYSECAHALTSLSPVTGQAWRPPPPPPPLFVVGLFPEHGNQRNHIYLTTPQGYL